VKEYAFTYYGEPKFANPEAGKKHLEKFMAWIGGLGDALVNPGTPLGETRTVSSAGVTDGGGPRRLTGFSIVKADSLDAAVEMARRCPHLEHGTVDVSETMEMTM
jgi:hypothetical protein